MRLFDAEQTRAALPFDALIEALQGAFAQPAAAPPRHHHALPADATLLLMPAWQAEHMGVKLVTVHPDNAARGLPAVNAAYVLSELATGRTLALLDGDVLTARRTAAVSALATRLLARPSQGRLLVVGAGRVGSLLAEAHAAAWPVRSVAIWSRNPDHAETHAATLRKRGHLVRAVTDLRAAVAEADVVSCATLSATPLIQGAWLRPGTHLDLLGAYRPSIREADAAALEGASVYVDTPTALDECGELAGWSPDRLAGTLEALCRGAVPRRGERTVFKSVGTALADLAAARLAVAAGA